MELLKSSLLRWLWVITVPATQKNHSTLQHSFVFLLIGQNRRTTRKLWIQRPSITILDICKQKSASFIFINSADVSAWQISSCTDIHRSTHARQTSVQDHGAYLQCQFLLFKFSVHAILIQNTLLLLINPFTNCLIYLLGPKQFCGRFISFQSNTMHALYARRQKTNSIWYNPTYLFRLLYIYDIPHYTL